MKFKRYIDEMVTRGKDSSTLSFDKITARQNKSKKKIYMKDSPASAKKRERDLDKMLKKWNSES